MKGNTTSLHRVKKERTTTTIPWVILIVLWANMLLGCATHKWAGIGFGTAVGSGLGAGVGGAVIWQDRQLAAGVGALTGAAIGFLVTYLIHEDNENNYLNALLREKRKLDLKFKKEQVKIMESSKRKPKLEPIYVDEKVENGRYMPPRIDWKIEKEAPLTPTE